MADSVKNTSDKNTSIDHVEDYSLDETPSAGSVYDAYGDAIMTVVNTESSLQEYFATEKSKLNTVRYNNDQVTKHLKTVEEKLTTEALRTYVKTEVERYEKKAKELLDDISREYRDINKFFQTIYKDWNTNITYIKTQNEKWMKIFHHRLEVQKSGAIQELKKYKLTMEERMESQLQNITDDTVSQISANIIKPAEQKVEENLAKITKLKEDHKTSIMVLDGKFDKVAEELDEQIKTINDDIKMCIDTLSQRRISATTEYQSIIDKISSEGPEYLDQNSRQNKALQQRITAFE